MGKSVSWSYIREIVNVRKDRAEVSRCLQVMRDKLGEQAWLEACHREMGWKRTSSYNHLNPLLLDRQSQRDRARRTEHAMLRALRLHLNG